MTAVLALVLTLCVGVPFALAAPLAPLNVQATGGVASPTIASVTWDASTGATGYHIYRSVMDTSTVSAWERIGSSSTTTFNDVDGVPGQDYWYKVSAHDAAGDESARSASTTPAVRAEWVQNPHGTYTSTSNNCTSCHETHEAATDTYILRHTGAADAVVGVCFACHDGTGSSASSNIKRYYPTVSGGLAIQESDGSTNFGHRIQTPGGSVDVGEGLPCYNCHDPHSAEPDALRVKTSIAGAVHVLGDTPGEIDMSTDAGNRLFCFTCHTGSKNAGALTTYEGTNSTGTGYTSAIVATDKVEGISRLAYDADAKTGLRLPPLDGHYTDLGTQPSCYQCHLSEYDTATSNNVHNPGPGLSPGGIACYVCHSAYKSPMDKTGATRAESVHHVMGSPTQDGDIAPNTGAYPSAADDVFCVSCHTDHNYFNGATTKAGNLRTSARTASGDATSTTDFINSGTYGVCVSCHATSLTKQGMGTDQLNVGAATTPVIPGAEYNTSAHQYVVPSAFGASSTFQANCSKCHSDEQKKSFASGDHRFGTHYSASAGILGALGANPPKEEACFACHNATAAKYGETLSAAAKGTQGEFEMTGSTHDLTKVACVNCHNVHEATQAVPVANPDNTYDSDTYSAYDVTSPGANGVVSAYCLACHDGAGPAQVVSATSLVPDTVDVGANANVGTHYTSSGHGVAEPGPAFTGRAFSGYASNFTGAGWTSQGNSLGAPEAPTPLVATSPSAKPFDGTHTFTFPAPPRLDSIDTASVTVVSRAIGNWGALTGGTTSGSTNSGALGNGVTSVWNLNLSATKADAVNINDGDAGYISRASGNTNSGQGFTFTPPAIPADATNISVSVSFIGRGTGTGTNQVGVYLRVNGQNRPIQGIQNLNTTTYNTNPYTYTWNQNPATNADWTVNQINNGTTTTGLYNFGVMTGGTVTNGCRVTYCYMTISYQVPGFYNDAWAIQYTTDGTNWTTAVGPSSAADGALTQRTFPVAGLTPSNYSNFAVRLAGDPGTSNSTGQVDWESSRLDITYSGADAGAIRADCRDCHEQHGSDLVHLLKTSVDGRSVSSYADTADQAQCLACHRTGGVAESANIAQYYPTTASGEAVQDDLPVWERFGHRIKTGPSAGQAMPCRSCHNPHGSADSGYMLAVRTQVEAGVDTVIGLTAGQLVMEDSTQIPANANNVRRFCFTCHTTSDTSAGWNGSAMAVVPAGAEVMGVSRTGGVLKVPDIGAIPGHKAAETTYSCYLCHGDDFSAPGSVNVHNPAAGESRGGIPCYVCHTVYRDQMEDGAGAQIGGSRKLTYHHVLGGASRDGDSITYPAVTADGLQDVYCLSCHVDHDKFSPLVNGANQRSRNLRGAYDNAAATAANTDWSATGGVCLGCHSVELSRDNDNQKAETNSTKTPAIGSAAYDASAHQYIATSTFTDATTFNGDCVKCHDSEIDGGGMERGKSTTGFQTSPNKFSVHTSANRRILAAMGVAIEDPAAEEQVCYRCHSLAGEGLKNATYAGKDWYGIAMPTTTPEIPSEAIYGLMNPLALNTPNYWGHNVGDSMRTGLHKPSPADETRAYLSANEHVECADCHNVHSATTARHTGTTTTGNRVSGALQGVPGAQAAFSTTNWTSPTGYTQVPEATYEYQICFKCHSGYNTNTQAQGQTTLITWGGTGAEAWTDQGLEFSPANESFHPVVAALNSAGSGSSTLGAAGGTTGMRTTAPTGGTVWHNGDVMYCSDCHAESSAGSLGPHGSAVKWILKGPNQAWPYTLAAYNGTNRTSNFRLLALSNRDANYDTRDGLFCFNCHVLRGEVHTRSNDSTGLDDHGGVACVGCHVRVPHGGKALRLISATGSSASYPGNMPARYSANGEGQPFATGIWIHHVSGASSNGCGATSSGCSRHSLNTGQAW